MTLALTRRLTAVCALTVLAAPLTLHAQSTPQAPKQTLDFSGWMFGSFQYRTDSTAKASNGGKALNQFGLDRAYLTFRVPVGDRALVRVTTDVFQQANSGYYSGWDVRIKYAYLQYDIAKDIGDNRGLNLTGRIGILHTVAIDHEEQYWARYMQLTGIERNGFFSSADAGAALLLTLPQNFGEIYGTVTNGPGYASNETDRFKDFALRVSIQPFAKVDAAKGLFKTFVISPWVYKGYTASKFQNDPATLPAGWNGNITDGLARDRYGLFVGNKDRRLTLGTEIAHRTEDVESGNNVATSPRAIAQREGDLLGAFLIVRPGEWADASKHSPFGLIGRIDQFKPNKNAAAATATTAGPDAADRFLLGSVFWETTSRTTLALDYQAQTRTSGSRNPEQKTLFLHWTATF